jgi:ABC-2 type transport system ATP-binding protein
LTSLGRGPSFLAVIEVHELSKRYGDLLAVDQLSFAVGPGEIHGRVGPNGAGKTTTLRALAGILRPSSGRIVIAGIDLAADPVRAKGALAFVPDEPQLFDDLTVIEHLRFTARLYGIADIERLAPALLEEMELGPKRDVLSPELSRGMKQKLAIACGLLHSPQALLFDEPLTGLDPLGIRRMKKSIVQRARSGCAIVLSSHLLHLLEEVCTHVLILKRGTKIADGTLGEVAAQFSNGESGVDLEEVFIRATGGSEQ